jgi:MFS family permease
VASIGSIGDRGKAASFYSDPEIGGGGQVVRREPKSHAAAVSLGYVVEVEPQQQSPARPVDALSPFAPLRVPSFRWLVTGLLATTLSSQVQGVAVAWQIYAITKSPLALGMVGLAEALPSIAVALFAGHAADVGNRQRIAIASLAALLVCSAALFGLSLFPAFYGIEWLIYGIIAASGVARGFLGPSRTALSAEVIPRELFASSVNCRTGTWQVAAVTGPALGGVLYAIGAERLSYGVTVALACAALVFQGLVRSPARKRADAHGSILESLKEGISFIARQRIVLGAISLDLFAVLFGGAVALLPIFAGEILRVGPVGLGLLRAAPAAGAVVMSLALTRKGPFVKAGTSMLVSVAIFGLCMIGFGLSTSYSLSLALLALSGAVDHISVVIRHTLIQVVTPQRMLGRVVAVNNIFIGSSNELGAFESGVAARVLGTVPSVVAGGIVTLVVVAATAWYVPELRRLRQIEAASS